MAEKLRPCPFCGGEAEEFTGEDAAPHRWTVECESCGAHVGSDTRHKARAKWNRRAGTTCEQRRTRRTCRVGCYPPGYEDNLHYEVCSECGTILTASRPGDSHAARASYCPSCGAKVLGE